MPVSPFFLKSWSDVQESEDQQYIDYEALINSDDEFLCLESLALDSAHEF